MTADVCNAFCKQSYLSFNRTGVGSFTTKFSKNGCFFSFVIGISVSFLERLNILSSFIVAAKLGVFFEFSGKCGKEFYPDIFARFN